MKILAFLPDPRSAHGLGEALAALPRGSVRAVAFGQATAAALPPDLDTIVYPVREGTRLPAPFYAALVDHERPDVVLAPAGTATTAPVPTMLVDLNGPLPLDGLPPLDDPTEMIRVEAITGDAERRRALIRGGLFTVRLDSNLFSSPGKVSPGAALTLHARLAAMLPRRPGIALAPVPEAPAPGPQPVRVVTVSGPSPRPVQAPQPVAAPLPVAAPPPLRAPDEVHGAQQYRGRHRGARVLVVAAGEAVARLTPLDLTQSIVVAVPEALPAIAAQMGLANYVCAAAAPGHGTAASALERTRAVVVHAEHIDGAALSTTARARVPIRDLGQAGGPALGWSDELGTGFFPAGGDAALAVQWAAWLEPAEIAVVGRTTHDERWPAFLVGAQELLASRGIAVEIDREDERPRRARAAR